MEYIISDSVKLKSQRRSRTRKILKENFPLFIMSLPGMIFLFIFSYLPMFGVVMAFKDYVPRKGIFGSEWVGFDNFKFFFRTQDAARTIRNTLLYGIDFQVVNLVMGVVMALLLFHLKNQRALKVYHTILMLPRFLSIVIVSFMSYAVLSPSYGFLNRVITALGGEAIAWYYEPKYWPFILTIVNIWIHLGTGCLYYYAALVGIDDSLFEAASLDGANVLQKCWHIAIPELIPIISMMLILGVGNIVSSNTGLFYNIPRNSGSLYPTTDVIGTYVYRSMLTGDLQKSSAIGLAQSFTGMILVLVTNAIIRKMNPDNAMF